MITSLLSVVLWAVASPSAAAQNPNEHSCPVSVQVMMGLPIKVFDQDQDAGWRAIESKPGCGESDAAEVIKRYRLAAEDRLKTLTWHEGQLRANIGETTAAMELMSRSRRDGDDTGWNDYVDATVAFLRRDRRALDMARARLASTPLPKGFSWVDDKGATRTDTPPDWPTNLDIVDGLRSCIGKSYFEAYSNACKASAKVGAR